MVMRVLDDGAHLGVDVGPVVDDVLHAAEPVRGVDLVVRGHLQVERVQFPVVKENGIDVRCMYFIRNMYMRSSLTSKIRCRIEASYISLYRKVTRGERVCLKK